MACTRNGGNRSWTDNQHERRCRRVKQFDTFRLSGLCADGNRHIKSFGRCYRSDPKTTFGKGVGLRRFCLSYDRCFVFTRSQCRQHQRTFRTSIIVNPDPAVVVFQACRQKNSCSDLMIERLALPPTSGLQPIAGRSNDQLQICFCYSSNKTFIFQRQWKQTKVNTNR